jgi:hypothetical protein
MYSGGILAFCWTKHFIISMAALHRRLPRDMQQMVLGHCGGAAMIEQVHRYLDTESSAECSALFCILVRVGFDACADRLAAAIDEVDEDMVEAAILAGRFEQLVRVGQRWGRNSVWRGALSSGNLTIIAQLHAGGVQVSGDFDDDSTWRAVYKRGDALAVTEWLISLNVARRPWWRRAGFREAIRQSRLEAVDYYTTTWFEFGENDPGNGHWMEDLAGRQAHALTYVYLCGSPEFLAIVLDRFPHARTRRVRELLNVVPTDCRAYDILGRYLAARNDLD